MSESSTSTEALSPARSAPVLPGSAGEDGRWTKIITPTRGLFQIPWGEVWRYRDLIWLLAWRDLATSYKQTVLGTWWFVLQPLMVTAVFSYLFGRMAGFRSDNIPHYLFYMSGLVVWGFFAECVTKTARVFTENQQIFSKVYYPRLVAPSAIMLKNIVPLAIQFGIFLAGLGFYLLKHDPYVNPNWLILLTPLIFLQTAMLGIGLGCIVAALTKRFQDLVFGIQIGLQLWMFGSAIVFPISRIAPDDRWVFFLNPIVPIIELMRLAYVGISLVEPRHIIYSACVSVVTLFVGVVMFNRAEQTSMDTI